MIIPSEPTPYEMCIDHSMYEERSEYTFKIDNFNEAIKTINWSSPNVFIFVDDDGFIPNNDIVNINERHVEKYNSILEFVRHGDHVCTDMLLKRWGMCKTDDESKYTYYNRITQDMFVHHEYFHYSIDRLKFGNAKNIVDIFKHVTSCKPINYADVEDCHNFYFNTPSMLHFQLAPHNKICDFDSLPTQAKRVNQHNKIYCKFLSKTINENFEERGIRFRADADGKLIYLLLKRYLKTHEKNLFERMYATIMPCWSLTPAYEPCVKRDFQETTTEDDEDFDLLVHPAYIRKWKEYAIEDAKRFYGEH